MGGIGVAVRIVGVVRVYIRILRVVKSIVPLVIVRVGLVLGVSVVLGVGVILGIGITFTVDLGLSCIVTVGGRVCRWCIA